jgi:hypothetical protein
VIPDISGLIRVMVVLSVVGLLAIVVGSAAGASWIIHHVRFQ